MMYTKKDVDDVVFLETLNNETVTFFKTNRPCGGSLEYTVKVYTLGGGPQNNNVKIYVSMGGSPRDNV